MTVTANYFMQYAVTQVNVSARELGPISSAQIIKDAFAEPHPDEYYFLQILMIKSACANMTLTLMDMHL